MVGSVVKIQHDVQSPHPRAISGHPRQAGYSAVIAEHTAYVLAVIFLATMVRSTLGFGEALVAVPLLALRIPVAVAAPLAVAASILVAAGNLVADWRHVEIRTARGLILSALCGLPVGIYVLRVLDDRVVKLLLGAIIIAIAIYSLRRRSEPTVRPDNRFWMIVAGLASGVLGGAYGMNGPPLAIYGAHRGWTPRQFRATLQGYFIVASLAGLIGYAAAGLWSATATHYLLLSLPSIAGAILLARLINRKTDGKRFFRIVYGVMMVIGAVLIGQAVAR